MRKFIASTFFLTFVFITALLQTGSAHAQEDIDPEILVLGAETYNRNCSVCHGVDGEGRIGVTLFKDWPSIRPDLVSKSVIEKGIAGSPMPGWSIANGGPLNKEEIEAVVTYILSFQTGGVPIIVKRPTLPPFPLITALPDVVGDPNSGAILYYENCKACHGAEGEGLIGVSLLQNWPSIRPDLTLKSTITKGVTGSPMNAWSTDNGGPLSNDEINDLVAYIMTWEVPVESSASVVADAGNSPFSGIGGILLGIALFVIIITLIVYIQIRTKKNSL